MFHSARYIFVLLLVLVACAGSLIFCTDLWKVVSGAEKYTPIFSGKQFTENELIQIELAFADAKLSDYVISDGTVQVPKRQKTVFLQALKKIDFLIQEESGFQSSSGGLFVSEKEREAAVLRDKQMALAAQIRTFHGIESARVLLDVSETKVGFTREKHASAAISIRSRAGYSVTQEDVQAILRLVTCSVCWLKPANVTIVDTRTNQSWHFDAPQIEVVPGNAVSTENPTSDGKANGANQSQKIVFQSASLPQPELFSSAARGILQTSAEEPVAKSQPAVSQPQNLGQITFGDSSTPDTLPELVHSEEAPTILFPKNSGSVNLISHSSSQHPKEIKILFGVVMIPIILICVWVIYVTRKGLFSSETRKNHEESASKPIIKSVSYPTSPSVPSVSRPVSEPTQELMTQLIAEISSESGKETQPEAETTSEVNSGSESETDSGTENLPNLPIQAAVLPIIEGDSRGENNSLPENEFQRAILPELAELERVAPNRLALAFLEERPQTAAMLLAQFQPETASSVLMYIPAKPRLGIESRMVSSQIPNAEILRDAAQAIQEHLDELEGAQNQIDLLQNDLKLLKELPTDETPKKKRLRPLAEVLPKERILRFEDLKSCTDGELRGILRGTSVQDVNLALLGAEPELVTRVMGVLPKQAAKELQFQLTHPGKIRLVEVEEARQRMMELAGV